MGVVRPDGTVRVKVIAPGWGSSGYYSAEVLERDAARFANVLCFWDHPTATEERERPERSLRDLAGRVAGTPVYERDGVSGPGVYADLQVFSPYREALNELAPHIGVSIRAIGQARPGEAEGRTGLIVERITRARSVDFVTEAGAGGKVLQIFEAARRRGQEWSEGGVEVNDLDAARTRIAELEAQVAEALAENQRLGEALVRWEAKDVAVTVLGDLSLPAPTRDRLVEVLAQRPTVRDGQLDREAFVAQVREAARAEIEYLTRVTGSGRIVGMGASDEASADETTRRLTASFARLGLDESAAVIAARGRS